MMMTIAICAMVVASRDSQYARNAGIRNGSGTRLTGGALIGGGGRGNCLLWRAAAQVEPPDQPRHRQPLDEDREGDDDEGGYDDRAALRHSFGNCKRKGQGERAPESAPE